MTQKSHAKDAQRSVASLTGNNLCVKNQNQTVNFLLDGHHLEWPQQFVTVTANLEHVYRSDQQGIFHKNILLNYR